MTSLCILCPPREGEERHAPAPGWQCCLRAHDRMLAALRDIPVLVVELSGLGYVERDTRMLRCTTKGCRWRARWRTADWPERPAYCDGDAQRLLTDGQAFGFYPVVSVADPVANVLTAGPTNGARTGPRVMGGGERSLPIRIDPTDLLAPARPASLAVADTGLYASDQIGHLAVATELEFWARDWADLLGHHIPLPTVPELARWLLNRLDWACAIHPALDEFAGKLTHLRTVLTAATGRLPARPDPVDRPCPACHFLMLRRLPDSDYIDCAGCGRVLTDDEYRDHLEDVIKTNWTRFDYNDKANTAPKHSDPVLIREDFYTDGVTLGYFDGYTFRTWAGSDDCSVSYWAEIHYPADPGPAKEDAA